MPAPPALAAPSPLPAGDDLPAVPAVPHVRIIQPGLRRLVRHRRTAVVIGRIYLERGRPVTVTAAYALPGRARPLPPTPPWLIWHLPPAGAPRNVAAERRDDGTTVVRPFRGLRRPR